MPSAIRPHRANPLFHQPDRAEPTDPKVLLEGIAAVAVQLIDLDSINIGKHLRRHHAIASDPASTRALICGGQQGCMRSGPPPQEVPHRQ